MANSKQVATSTFLDGCVIERDYFFFATRLDAQPYDEYDHGRLVWYDAGKWVYKDRRWQVNSVCILPPSKETSNRGYVGLEEGTGIVGIYWPGTAFTDETLPGAEDGHGMPSMMQIRWIDGALYACGYGANVFRRTHGKWEIFNAGLKALDFGDYLKQGMSVPEALDAEKKTQRNIRTLDGLSQNNLFCAGWRGIIFHCDGHQWRQLESPTNTSLNRIKCVDDNSTYIVGDGGVLLKGNAKGFQAIATGIADDFVSVTWFNGKLYVGGEKGLYSLNGQTLHRVDVGQKGDFRCIALDANDGQLLAVSERWFLVFDGQDWKRIDDPDNVP